MSVNGNVEHIIWRDNSNPEIIRVRCGHLEVPLKKKSNYCPVCGENIEDLTVV